MPPEIKKLLYLYSSLRILPFVIPQLPAWILLREELRSGKEKGADPLCVIFHDRLGEIVADGAVSSLLPAKPRDETDIFKLKLSSFVTGKEIVIDSGEDALSEGPVFLREKGEADRL